MADIKRLEEALVNAHNSGDANAARIFAAEIVKTREQPPEGMPENRGVLESVAPAIKRGFGQFGEIGSGLGLAASKVMGDEASVAKKMAEAKADIQTQKDRGLSVADIQRIYKEKGLVNAAGAVPQYLIEQTLQSLPTMATPLATGMATTALTAPVLGPFAPVAGTLAGIGAYGIQTFGSGIQRQAVEKQKPEEIDVGKAAVASAIGAPLGYFMDRITALGGAKGVKEVAKELAARKTAGEIGAAGVAAGVAKQTAKGTGVGFIAEAPTETLEAVLDRWQAGLSLTGEEAKQEYIEAGIGGGGVGGTIGGASRGVRTYGEYRGAGKPQQSEFDRRRAEIEGKAPAITPFDEASPLENPYGNIPAADIGDVAAQINGARAKRKQSPLQSFSVEDIVESGLPPEQTDQLLSAALTKSGFDPSQAVEPQDIMDAAAERGLDPEQPGFRDFLRRSSGAENPEQMTPVQRVAAFGAIQSLPEGVDSLPTGTNAQRFTEPQYRGGLKAIKGAISGGASRDSLIAAIQKTGVDDVRDAQSILQNAIKGGELGAVSTPTFTVMDDFGKPVRSYDSRDPAEQLAGRLNGQVEESSVTKFVSPEMAGGDVRPGSYRDEPSGFEIRAGDAVLRKTDTAEDAEVAAERLQQIRGRLASTFNNQVEGINQKIATSNQPLEVMEAQGQAETPQYAKLKKQADKAVQELTKKRDGLVKQAAEFSRPLHVGVAAPKAVGKTGFTRFEGGRPVEYLSSLGALPKPTTGPVTDRDVANIDALRKTLLPALKRFGLEGVGLRVVKSIEDGGAGADGSYASRLIQIALSAENPMGVMRHEVIHALKELGAFKTREWRALERQAKSEWIGKFIEEPGLMERYQQVYQEQAGSLEGFDEYIAEEAIAEAFKYFDQTKPPVGLIGNLFNRLRNLFGSLRNALQGAGFQTADEVLGKIEEGKVTPAQAEAPAAAPKFSFERASDEQFFEGERKQPKSRQVVFEIAPNPDDKDLSALWGSLSHNQKIEISNKVKDKFTKSVMDAIGARGRVTSQVGSYLDETNASYAMYLEKGNAINAANALGFVFKQQSMLVVSPTKLSGLDNFGSVVVDIGDKSFYEIEDIYNTLRSININGKQPVSGQTTSNGKMIILNKPDWSGVETDELAEYVDAAFGYDYNVLTQDVFASFPEAKDYDYASPENDPAGSRGDIRRRLRVIRDEASKALGEEIAAARKQAAARGETTPLEGPRVTTDTIVVDGKVRPTKTSAGTLIYPTEDGVKNFWRWFGKSVFVDDKGRPMVMYHGTARDIEEFVPKQANAIFITPNAKFAGGVSLWSEDWMFRHYDEILSEEQIETAKLKALEKIDPETKKAFRLSKDADHSAFVDTAEFEQAIKDQMPSRANTIPLFVKSENPFDYENVIHVRDVVDRLFLDSGVDLEKDPNGVIRFENENGSVTNKDYSEGEVYKLLGNGYWPLIEQPELQDAIRKLKFDGFSVKESLIKNFAVFDPNQVKSAIGNDGRFSEKKGIRYSIAQTKTEPFKRFFGESKIVDKNGNPLMMYHATPSPDEEDIFSAFNISDDGKLGQGIYATSVEKYAESFAPDGAVIPLWISIKNPLYIDLSSSIEKGRSPRDILRAKMAGEEQSGKGDYLRLDGSSANEMGKLLSAEIQAISGRRLADMSGATIRRTLQKAGYDGVVVRDTDGNFVEVNAFDKTQVKSAIGNQGTFSPKSKDIRFSLSQTKTPEFKRWFGDSKVVDDKGEPLVVYHGTSKDKDFTSFNVGTRGSWFTTSPDEASSYAKDNDSQGYKYEGGKFIAKNVASRVMPVYLSIQNPYVLTKDDLEKLKGSSYAAAQRDVFSVARSRGFDGIDLGNGVWVVLKSPTQIKSATGNRGTFDPASPDIRYSLRDDIKSKLGQGALSAIDRTTSARQGNAAQKFASAISPDSFTKIRQRSVNKYESIERNSKTIADRFGESRLYADYSAIGAALFSDRAAGISAESFKNGVPVYANGFTKVDDLGGKVKGLLPILEPLMKYNDQFVFQAFQFYGATRRGARLMVEGREKLLTPQDIRFGKQLEQTYPEFKTVFDEYQKYNRGIVKFLVDTGVLTEEMGKKWVMYADYIPFYRQADGEETFGPKIFYNLSGVQPTKRLKGGEFKLDDFIETVVRNTRSAVEQGMKNVAAQRAVRDAVELNSPGKNDYAKRMPPGTAGAPDIVTVREKGRDVQYLLADPLLYEALKGLNLKNPYEDILRIVGFPTRMLRELVTKMPDFMLANLFRDSAGAWTTSGAKFIPIIDTFVEAGKVLVGMSPEANALKAAGIGTGYEFSGDIKAGAKQFAKELRKVSGKRTAAETVLLPITKVWDILDAGSNASDLATRAVIYKRTMEETGNEAEAALRALEVMNFGRMGSSPIYQIFSAIVPFFGARVQGLDLLYRAGTGRLAQANRDAAHKAFKIRALTLFSLSIAYWMLASDSDEYKKANEETRDNNWIIGSVMVPIPFEIGVLFKVIPERMMGYLFGTDTGKDVKKAAVRNIISTLSMNPVPQGILPILEANVTDSGYSAFTGRGIIPRGMEDVSPQFQETPTTSTMAKKLGKELGVSPIKIDHVIRGYFGAMGTYASMGIDSMLRTVSDPVKPAMGIEQTPIIKRFYASPLAGGTKEAFFDLKDRIDEVVRTQKFLMESGRYEDLTAYMKENGKLIDAKSWVSNTEKELKNVRELIRATSNLNERNITPEEKREALNSLRRSENYLTEQSRTLKKSLMK